MLKGSFPYLNVDHLSEGDAKKLVFKLMDDTMEVVDRFEDLVCDTFESFDKLDIDFEAFKSNAFTFGEHKLPLPYKGEHLEQLNAAKSIREIQSFLVRYKYISFFNFGILEKLVQRHGAVEDKKRLEDHLTKFGVYCKRSIFEVPASIIAKVSPGKTDERVKRLILKINESHWFRKVDQPDLFSMDDLYALQRNIARVLGLDPAPLLLCDVRMGCVEITFDIHLVDSVENLHGMDLLDDFSLLGVNHASMILSPCEYKLQPPLEYDASDGSFLWRINNVLQTRRNAIEERVTMIASPPFYTSSSGYKACLVLYPNGARFGYGTHISFYLVLMKGGHDDKLNWPFTHKISLVLVEQVEQRRHIIQTLDPSTHNTSVNIHIPRHLLPPYQFPDTADIVTSFGLESFARLSSLDDYHYVLNDTMFLKCIVHYAQVDAS